MSLKFLRNRDWGCGVYLWVWALCLACGTSLVGRPNIVFIFSDDHAREAISAYGGRFAESAPTPNIDRLANEGALFRNSFCSNSICGPSRAAILTGKHSHKNGFMRNGDVFDGTQTTLPKLLQAAGYQTAIIGKWHLKSEPIGFDHWEVLPGQGHYYRPDFRTAEGLVSHEGYVTDVITDRAIEWLEKREQPSEPFMLMCQHKAPHRNWAPPLKYLEWLDTIDLPEPASLWDDYANRSPALQQNEMEIGRHMHWQHDFKFHGRTPFPEIFVDEWSNAEYGRMTEAEQRRWDEAYTPKNAQFISDYSAGRLSEADVLRWKYQRYLKDYLRVVRSLDDNIGRLLDYLDETGLSENTVVIYSSDQGFYLGEHGWFDKRWMFEESLFMPFLIRWPGHLQPGARPEALIQNIDYAPTLLEMAEVPVPSGMQGRSLLPLLRGEMADADLRDAIYYAYYHNPGIHNVPLHDGVRSDRYKLMYLSQTDEWQLFDLERDPQELSNVYDQPEYAPVRIEMQARYQQIRAQYGVEASEM